MTVIELRNLLNSAIEKGLEDYPVFFPHPDSGRVDYEVGIIKRTSDRVVIDERPELTALGWSL